MDIEQRASSLSVMVPDSAQVAYKGVVRPCPEMMVVAVELVVPATNSLPAEVYSSG